MVPLPHQYSDALPLPRQSSSSWCSTSQARAPRFDERRQLPVDHDGKVRVKWDFHPAKARNTERRMWGDVQQNSKLEEKLETEASKRSSQRQKCGRLGRRPGPVRSQENVMVRLLIPREAGEAWRGRATAEVSRSLAGLLGCI